MEFSLEDMMAAIEELTPEELAASMGIGQVAAMVGATPEDTMAAVEELTPEEQAALLTLTPDEIAALAELADLTAEDITAAISVMSPSDLADAADMPPSQIAALKMLARINPALWTLLEVAETHQRSPMEDSAKILLLGKTGVGKSSFINYFLGKNVAEAAAGKPVTQELFFPYAFTDGRYPIEIFDTRGLEALNANSQLDEIITAVKERNDSDDIVNWFHTIFYCISMSNPRFEDFEARFIRRLQQELTQHIHIILTHCDTCSAENIAHMRQKIALELGNLDNIEIFEVVCISKKKRNGTIVEPHGKEAVSARVFDLFLEDIAYKLSASYARELDNNIRHIAFRVRLRFEDAVDELITFKSLMKVIQDGDSADSYADSILNDAWEELQDDIERVKKQADEEFEEILKPAARLFQSYRGVVTESFTKNAQLGFDDMVWNFQPSFSDDEIEKTFSISTIFPSMARNGYMDGSGDFNTPQSFFGTMGMIGSGIRDLFNMKKNMKNAIRSMFDKYIQSMPSEDDIQKAAYKRIVGIIGG